MKTPFDIFDRMQENWFPKKPGQIIEEVKEIQAEEPKWDNVQWVELKTEMGNTEKNYRKS